jgi:signal transduction histidine kinase
MRLGIRSIRARITVLLLIPLLSLAGLWIYTTASSVSGVYSLLRVDSVNRWVGRPADQLAQALQAERLAAVRYTAAPGGAVLAKDLVAFQQAEHTTDQLATVLDGRAGTAYSGVSAEAHARLQDIVNHVDLIGGIRQDVLQRRLEWDAIYAQYTDLLDPFFQLRSALSGLETGQLARQAGDLIELVRAHEYLSREDALYTGAQTSGSVSPSVYQTFLATVDGERLLFNVYLPELPDDQQNLYDPFVGGSTRASLGGMEASISAAGTQDAPRAVDPNTWRATMDDALSQLTSIEQQSADLASRAARDTAYGVMEHDAVVGALGLLAFLVSLWVSLRVGRGLVRELIGLRNAAFDLAGTRLPSVMRRLRDGERVDVAAEAPPLQLTPPRGPGRRRRVTERDEIAQVGRAFDAVQRAAVEAAVDQAELRRGISAVFVNLARRSQALLNRQLTLLDDMERRAADPSDLEDLFQLDHLTTRMRRHADGLLILSGGGLGRAARRPARVLDVVRAAVGEVEDYTRVTVHPLPPVAVLGAAVSDVVHLLAELVENATVYSPPHTRVQVQGDLVAQGLVLEIDDRGLGMGDQALQDANDRLATGGDFDLTDSDRLGLFVVSRLAARHGIRVTLRQSPYGGTTAVVLLPEQVLVPLPKPERPAAPTAERAALQAAPEPGPDAGSGVAALPTRRPRPMRGLPSPRGPQPAASGPSAPAADRSGAAASAAEAPRHDSPGRPPLRPVGPRPARVEPTVTGSGLPRRVPAGSSGATASGAPAPAAGRDRTEGDAPPLPRRVRQASLAPQLRDGPPPGAPEPTRTPARERTPEEARAVFGSFQRGLARGRGVEERTPGDSRP